MLYVVGSRDRLLEAGQAWISALQERGVEAHYAEFPDMPHGFYWGNSDEPPPQFFAALEKTSQFIERHTSQ